MFYCCFRGKVPMIFGCPIVGSRLRGLLGCLSCLRNLLGHLQLPFIRHLSHLVTTLASKTAVALSSVPACPYAGLLLTTSSRRSKRCLACPRVCTGRSKPSPRIGSLLPLIDHMLRSNLGMMTGWESLKRVYRWRGSVAVVL
jgi:hypothetical protein